MPKTNAEICKEYRERKKAAKNKTKKASLSSTERVRNFRARQRFLRANILNIQNTEPSTDINSFLKVEMEPEYSADKGTTAVTMKCKAVDVKEEIEGDVTANSKLFDSVWVKKEIPDSNYTLEFNIKEEPTDDSLINANIAPKTSESSYIKQEYDTPDVNNSKDTNEIDIKNQMVLKQENNVEWFAADPNVSRNSVLVENVPLMYSSDTESENEEILSKKRKRRLKDWVFVNKFMNSKSAEEAVRAENTWSIITTNMTEDGKKVIYRCNKVKRRGPQCAAQIYLLFTSMSDEVLLFRTEAEHSHDSIGTRCNYGISQEVKKEINKLYDLHFKPKAILRNLQQKQGMEIPTIKQINNYLTDLRRMNYGSSTISLGELEKWLLDNSNVPENKHTVFVISHYICENDSPMFRFVLSTKYLLELACSAKIIHADATHKLIWQGFPVLIVGTTDRDKKFHPLCLGVSNCEGKEDFKMLFDGLKQNVLSRSLSPSVLVCDATKSLQSAFTEVFGSEVPIRICWAHAKKSMQAKLTRVVDKNIQKCLLEDIDALQLATSPEIFDAASQAFIKKWEEQKDFIEYFKEEWLNQNRNWYLGAVPGSPFTNNSLESFNKVIKDHNILRERYPLSRFLVVAVEMVTVWSQKNITESFSSTPTIQLDDWTKAYNWAKMDKKIKVLSSDANSSTYLVPSREAFDEKYDLGWKTFDEYKIINFLYWKVTIPKEKCEWIKSTCNCPQFFKEYMCKHVLGLAIKLKYITPPLEAKNIRTGQKRKGGRLTKSKPALIIQ